ncbi:MAG: YihY/virulence factor BrkB family protein [Chitinophagaceae bacterium]|jgi:membrane protein
MKQKMSFKGIGELLKDTFTGFSDDKITKLSGSLAYFTVFSMGPLLVVIISFCGIFLSREAIEGKVYSVLVSFVGSDTASQLQEIIRNASIGDKSVIAAIIGVIILLIGATSVFAEIQDSINIIWGVKPKPKKGWLKYLTNRFLSFSVIVSLGFLLLVSLALSAVIEMISGRLQSYFPEITIVVFYIINLILTVGISTLIFGTIFKVLPDAKIKWKDVFAGAVVTAVLFLIGKFAISLYISQAKVGSTYGAAGSLVILLVWVYYSSIILYLGAEFTKAYAVRFGDEIHPNDYAVSTRQVEIETGHQSVQENAGKS